MNILIYDCEIVRGIPPRGEDKLPDVEYCDGWKDHANMGVSVTGVYDYAKDAYRVFCDDNVGEMAALMHQADRLVGFNNVDFDDRLLAATYDWFEVISTPRYDLLREIWRAAEQPTEWGSPETHGGYGLDAMCDANFGERKTGHGADAPVNWQRGWIGSVIDYCLNDVRMTKLLMDAVLAGHPLVNPKGGLLYLRKPGTMTDEEFAESCPPEPPTGDVTKETTYENRAELTDDLGWEDIALTFGQTFNPDGYEVEVQDNDGVLVKTHVYLHEWSGEVTGYINDQDATGLINYLIGLNTTLEGERDGTIIR